MKPLPTIGILCCTWIFWLLISQYLLCARYQFPDPEPFEGPVVYNPYDSVSQQDWVKCNFHAHARAWNGVTNGKGSASDIHSAYDSLKYGVHCVSNYHHIDTTNEEERTYLPVYEHGYNTTKTHQLVLGSSNVQWLDYLLPQTVHNKQHVLDKLYEWKTVTVLNHPAIRNGYTKNDLAQLGNYDCMEVLSPAATSTQEWDAALSAGRKVFVVGNDDTHDVISGNRLGKMCTFVNNPAKTGSGVLEALRAGRSYGVAMGETQPIDSVPYLLYVKVEKDSVFIKVSDTAQKVSIYGQNGRTIKTARETDRIAFLFRRDDHYARAEFHFSNGTGIYLNPVFFTPRSGYRAVRPYVNPGETLLFRFSGILAICFWLGIVWRLSGGNGLQGFGTGRLAIK
ncbi:CehA/McbA family metallohydrolase domain-containing protein [Dyadobacter aurulentus]|uniref:hypothetical protein n=1 Tax=Dyadobacter sp. UC 10 TaxID=2605428 RepID=UPI0011F0E1AE|nr:hypothetical protein [Dyadobacter sp. UC 10]KAA0993342.1 hypothetical protein FXO21_25770 [Dyadobacter sp. UC 10]